MNLNEILDTIEIISKDDGTPAAKKLTSIVEGIIREPIAKINLLVKFYKQWKMFGDDTDPIIKAIECKLVTGAFCIPEEKDLEALLNKLTEHTQFTPQWDHLQTYSDIKIGGI